MTYVEDLFQPCDADEATCVLVDHVSPSEPALFFRTVQHAVDWAELDNDFRYRQYNPNVENWSVYKLNGKAV